MATWACLAYVLVSSTMITNSAQTGIRTPRRGEKTSDIPRDGKDTGTRAPQRPAQLCITYVGALPAMMPVVIRNIAALGERCEWALMSYTGTRVAGAWRTYLDALPKEPGHTVRLVADLDTVVRLRPKNHTQKFLSKWAMLSETILPIVGDYARILVRTPNCARFIELVMPQHPFHVLRLGSKK